MKNKHIVKANAEFQTIIDNAQYKKNNVFVVYYQKNDLDYLRFGISVGKKLGNAVFRNKLKRQMRNMLYDLKDEIYQKPFNIVLMARKYFDKQSYVANKELLIKLLQQIN